MVTLQGEGYKSSSTKTSTLLDSHGHRQIDYYGTVTLPLAVPVANGQRGRTLTWPHGGPPHSLHSALKDHRQQGKIKARTLSSLLSDTATMSS